MLATDLIEQRQDRPLVLILLLLENLQDFLNQALLLARG